MWNQWNVSFLDKNDMELKFHLMYNLKLHAKLYFLWKFSCNC